MLSSKLGPRALALAHEGHLGICGTRQNLRRVFCAQQGIMYWVFCAQQGIMYWVSCAQHVLQVREKEIKTIFVIDRVKSVII